MSSSFSTTVRFKSKMNLTRKLLHLTNKTLWIAKPTFTSHSFLSRFSTKANLSTDTENLEVNFENDVEQFPLVWLRDNCTCANCFHKQSTSRIINWNEFNIDAKVKSLEVRKHNLQKVNIMFASVNVFSVSR